jgi:hypothetical protein
VTCVMDRDKGGLFTPKAKAGEISRFFVKGRVARGESASNCKNLDTYKSLVNKDARSIRTS